MSETIVALPTKPNAAYASTSPVSTVPSEESCQQAHGDHPHHLEGLSIDLHKAQQNYGHMSEIGKDDMARHNSEDQHLEKKSVDQHGKSPFHHECATAFKYSYSLALLVFSVTVVMATIFTEQTKIAADVNVAVAFALIWVLTFWLAVMEGEQGCLVGLQPVDKSLYGGSHPKALMVTKLVHKGDNLDRFIVGRQFLVVLVIFCINMCGSALKDTSVLNLPDIMVEIFINSGVALILMTTILGQLTAQVNAADCMLDFINNYVALITAHISLFIEMSGLLHAVYLVQIIFAKIAGKSTDSDNATRSTGARIFFWLRVVFSVAILSFSFAVTLSALFQEKTTMYEGVPQSISVLLLFVLMAFVGLMEGMQIALFAVINMPKEELQKHSQALKVCDLVFSGSHLQAFLIGRQICVTCCMFIVARIATCSVDMDEGESTIFGVSSGIQNFFNTGLLGAIITTIVGSLVWRIIASTFPVAFLSNPLIYFIVRLCLLLEASGVCSAAWILALVQKRVAGYQTDDVHLGSSKTRDAIKEVEDDLEFQESSSKL